MMNATLANASRAVSAKVKSKACIASTIREQQPVVEAARAAYALANGNLIAGIADDISGALAQKMLDALATKTEAEAEFKIQMDKWDEVGADLEANTAHYHVKKKEVDDAAFDAAQLVQAARARDAAEIEDIIQRIRYAHSPSCTAPTALTRAPSFPHRSTAHSALPRTVVRLTDCVFVCYAVQ